MCILTNSADPGGMPPYVAFLPRDSLQKMSVLYAAMKVFSVLCLLCLCERLFVCALWPPSEKGLTSWLSFVVSNCEFVTFPLVSWVRCGT